MHYKKTLRKGDFVLLFIFIMAAALTAFLPLTGPASSTQFVRITCRGEDYGIFPLEEDREVDVTSGNHHNLVSIQGGTVHMESADCRNQVCVNTGTISRSGDLIVCLPNQVVVEIIGEEENEDEVIDSVVK
ncbi:MAG: NusG domain II-containing protein [Lachnospiraceae bacterium]|nr:NusG domain II-containing protein [Lachnospiraceae bacterium]